MVESARDTFEEPQLDSLRCIIRLTIEFFDYLQNGNPALQDIMKRDQHLHGGISRQSDEVELKYAIESIFSGIDAFCNLNSSYSVLVGATKSDIQWNVLSSQTLKDQFVSLFNEFRTETNFETQCRHLLDLFKMQIVFAGMGYD